MILKNISNVFSNNYWLLWFSWIRVCFFFCDKGFDIIGIDNNSRKFFFGKGWRYFHGLKKLKKKIKKYFHYNVDIKIFIN